MGKAKATLDTNILISALGWKGNPKQVFARAVEGEFELVISDKQLTELERVLDYPKFQFTEEQKGRFKALVLAVATLVKPAEKISVIKEDPDDNRMSRTTSQRLVECYISYYIKWFLSMLRIFQSVVKDVCHQS